MAAFQLRPPRLQLLVAAFDNDDYFPNHGSKRNARHTSAAKRIRGCPAGGNRSVANLGFGNHQKGPRETMAR